MLYLIYGTDEYLIKKEISKIIDIKNATTYDLYSDLIENILFDASNIPLFEESRNFIIYNSFIFTGEKGQIDQNIEVLENYLKNPNTSTNIIFVVNRDKLDSRKKILKLIKEVGKVIEVNNNNLNGTVKNMFDDYKVSNDLINLLIKRVGKNLNILENEITKIKIYKDKDFVITEEDIINLTTINYEIDIFKFIDNIINKNKEYVFTMYREMRKMNEEPIKIIITLANQVRLLLQTKLLLEQGLNESEIANKLGIHPYRIKLAREKCYSFTVNELKDILNSLADLDIDIKTGNIDKDLAFEMFILKL